MTSPSKKKLILSCTACVAFLSLLGIGLHALRTPTPSSPSPSSFPLSVNASIEEKEDKIKVFIGDIDSAPETYLQERVSYIKNLAGDKSNAATMMKAVIGLDDYYTVDEVTSWAEDYDVTISRVYMWPKGETGRLFLHVEEGDLSSSIEAYKQQVAENGSCDNPQFAKDYQRFLNGEYGIFALTVTASAEELAKLNAEADCVSYVDVMYNPEVEAYAEQVGKAVSYIELPAKPDGAL